MGQNVGRKLLTAMVLAASAGTALAQIPLPGAGLGGQVLNDVRGGVTGALDTALGLPATVAQDVEALARARLDRLSDFVRAHRGTVETDDTGAPARAHEILLTDPDPAALAQAEAAGFHLVETGTIDGLDVPFARVEAPAGESLAKATRRLRALLPGHDVSADPIHFPGGTTAPDRTAGPAMPRVTGGTVGIIDSGVPPSPLIAAQAGFAAGAPHPGQHAQAIASLLAGAGTARVLVGDVYGTDPAGGSALAIARALGWMAQRGAPVVSISLVGPANPLLARAIAAAQARGIIVVAAVGNDGAAAPPAYPASLPGVVAVTGVDGHRRPLFEAGHALHLDYAAPGADMTAIGLDGRARKLRGTSFAAPLVAARLATLHSREAADREAVAPGPRTGRGILCDSCRKGI